MIEQNSLCIVSKAYFDRFDNGRMMDKHSSRPYYFSICDDSGIIWVVPLSSQVGKYQNAIKAVELKRGKGNCIYYYIGRIMSNDRAFLIGDVIPVTEKYIERPYIIQDKPYIVEDKADIKQIRRKLSKYLALVRSRKLNPCVDIIAIERTLIHEIRK